jgi:hypothetical protein
LGGLCSSGASIKLIKKKVSEMFTWHSIVLVLKISYHYFKSENSGTVWLRKTKAIKWCIIHSQHAILVGKK